MIGLGALNRVLYRLALVPLRDYVFFLAQAQNVGYIVIYYLLLWIRYRCGASAPQPECSCVISLLSCSMALAWQQLRR